MLGLVDKKGENAEQSSRLFDRLVARCQQGCEDSKEELAGHVHDDFYRIARRLCGGNQFENSMHATNLLNETFLRLLKAGTFRKMNSKEHLYASAAKTMRCVIADYLRKRCAEKRPTSRSRSYLEDVIAQLQTQDFCFEELNEALQNLEATNPRQAKIVNMRFFLGMSIAETSEALAVSVSTVEKEWRQARIMLFKALR